MDRVLDKWGGAGGISPAGGHLVQTGQKFVMGVCLNRSIVLAIGALLVLVAVLVTAGAAAAAWLGAGAVIGVVVFERCRREDEPHTGVEVRAWNDDGRLEIKRGDSALLLIEEGDNINLELVTATTPAGSGKKAERIAVSMGRYLAGHRGRIVSDDLSFLEPP